MVGLGRPRLHRRKQATPVAGWGMMCRVPWGMPIASKGCDSVAKWRAGLAVGALVFVVGCGSAAPTPNPASRPLVVLPSQAFSIPTPTPTPTPIPLPTWNAVSRGHACTAITALRSAGTEATALQAAAVASRWTQVLSHAQRISSEAATAQTELAAFSWRGLPASTAIQTLSQAAHSYSDTAQSVIDDIEFGKTEDVRLDAIGLDPATIVVPSLDSQIRLLEVSFGAC
jgi:hypothetical protein